ncbi:MAG: tetratricopeptide repeat protein [Fimbriimonadaceae bacterium]|nr:tetratricopeptide repeat protein [Fimbriimonadaceae bacterium]
MLVLTCLGSLALIGCRSDFPDPNAKGPAMDVSTAQRNIQQAYVALEERLNRGQITPEQRDEFIVNYAKSFTEHLNFANVSPTKAWRYADVLKVAREWEKSAELYEIAVKAAPNPDRRVNDSLQLARVYAELGKIDQAIKTVESVFDVGVKDKAPILMATLYEIIPAAEGKGKEVQLAELLEKTIDQHAQTVVEPNLPQGQLFLSARPRHMRRAWEKAISLYSNAGRPDLARRAIQRMEVSLGKFATT